MKGFLKYLGKLILEGVVLSMAVSVGGGILFFVIIYFFEEEIIALFQRLL